MGLLLFFTDLQPTMNLIQLLTLEKISTSAIRTSENNDVSGPPVSLAFYLDDGIIIVPHRILSNTLHYGLSQEVVNF